MRERTVTISGLSKTYSCTGWRLGYAIAPEAASNAIRKVHDFLTVGAPAPLQAAAAVGMAFDADYYNHLMADYRARRDLLCGALVEAGFTLTPPEGAYYVLTGFAELSDKDDVTFARWLASDVGVATVPGSSFYRSAADGSRLIRFAFCKRHETLEAAVERLAAGLQRVTTVTFDAARIRRHAEQFSRQRHVQQMRALIDETLAAPAGTRW
jgi:aminotransferase